SPFLNYSNAGNGVNIAGMTINDATTVLVKRRTDGTLPATPFTQTASGGNLAADGSGGVNNSVLNFTNIDYSNGLGKNRAAQAQLYLVPFSPNGTTLSDASQVI